MSLDLAIVLALLAAAVVMFVVNRPRLDALGLIMIAALLVIGAGRVRTRRGAAPGRPDEPVGGQQR